MKIRILKVIYKVSELNAGLRCDLFITWRENNVAMLQKKKINKKNCFGMLLVCSNVSKIIERILFIFNMYMRIEPGILHMKYSFYEQLTSLYLLKQQKMVIYSK